MASTHVAHSDQRQAHRQRNRGAPTMWAAFAGIILFINGSLSVLYGLAAIINPKVATVGGHGVMIWDIKTWGWIVVIISALMIVAGTALLLGRSIGRWLGIVFASLSAISHFGTASAFPLWAVLVIALDVIIIYQLVVHWDPEP